MTATLPPSPAPSATLTATLTVTPSAVITGTPALTAAAAVTATGALTPTSAVAVAAAPDARLAEARWLQRIGDCDGARRTLAEYLAGDPPPPDAAEARYILAHATSAYAAAEAVTALNQLQAEGRRTAHSAIALFLLGEAQSSLGLWRKRRRIMPSTSLPLLRFQRWSGAHRAARRERATRRAQPKPTPKR
jgi:hypothetical protein